MTATTDYEAQGRLAFKQGAYRLVPRDILVKNGKEAARAWYRGWDKANLAAPWDLDAQ